MSTGLRPMLRKMRRGALNMLPTWWKVKDSLYRRRLRISLADWIIRHQEEIVFKNVRWMGHQTLKNPLDCWIYQEILWEVKPEVLIELGSCYGGSTMYFAHLFDIIGGGQVVSVDLDRSLYKAAHPRIIEITGDCSSPEIVARVRSIAAGKKTLVIHDADHARDAVLRDLRLYAQMVSVGSYLIVEDGIGDLFRDPAMCYQGGGPLAATRAFLKEDDRFIIDETRERYLITYNPRGFLKRVK